jgi:hypothetical protein
VAPIRGHVLSLNADGPRVADATPLALSKICGDKNNRINRRRGERRGRRS